MELKPEELILVKRLWRETHLLDIWRGQVDGNIFNCFTPTEEVDDIDFKYPDDYFMLLKTLFT